jgi:hypothetical protein
VQPDTQSPTRTRTDRLEREIRDAWSAFPSANDLATMPLTPVTGMPKAGSRPQLTVVDRHGARYLFKIAPRDQIAAELFAGRILALGQRLHVPTVRRELRIAGVPTGFGLLQPIVDVRGTLDVDPTRWTEEQIESLLRLHPWEWLTANLDTHVDQYVIVGSGRIPINIDWDHSLLDLAKTELTRFNRRSLAVVPVRNLLYANHVADRRPLQLGGLLAEAARVAAIPFDAIEQASRPGRTNPARAERRATRRRGAWPHAMPDCSATSRASSWTSRPRDTNVTSMDSIRARSSRARRMSGRGLRSRSSTRASCGRRSARIGDGCVPSPATAETRASVTSVTRRRRILTC